MIQEQGPSIGRRTLKSHPVASYFAITFAISWTGSFLVAAPHLLRAEPLPGLTGILMFPAMLLGPSLTGIFLTRLVDGRAGIRNLFSQMFRWRFRIIWYMVLIIPPALVLSILIGLKIFVSPVYAPNFFAIGILFGIPAGFLEEIGWMGYAFRKMSAQNNAVVPSILLGLLWSLWHLPVVNYLGASTPHGAYWFPFYCSRS